eukprot:357372-Chlamydomonas_euryale.AAC.2
MYLMSACGSCKGQWAKGSYECMQLLQKAQPRAAEVGEGGGRGRGRETGWGGLRRIEERQGAREPRRRLTLLNKGKRSGPLMHILHAFIHVRMHARMHACVHACIRAYVACMHPCGHVCMRACSEFVWTASVVGDSPGMKRIYAHARLPTADRTLTVGGAPLLLEGQHSCKSPPLPRLEVQGMLGSIVENCAERARVNSELTWRRWELGWSESGRGRGGPCTQGRPASISMATCPRRVVKKREPTHAHTSLPTSKMPHLSRAARSAAMRGGRGGHCSRSVCCSFGAALSKAHLLEPIRPLVLFARPRRHRQ